MTSLCFYSQNYKILPYIDEKTIEIIRSLEMGEFIELNNMKFTICSNSDIPDSRNKIGTIERTHQ